jgi:hypothetical protein
MKVYVVMRMDVSTFTKEDSIIEKVTCSAIEKIFTDEDRAVQYIRDTVQKWTKFYEEKIEQSESPAEKYRYACRLGGLKFMSDDVREGRLVNITDDMYYYYESNNVE